MSKSLSRYWKWSAVMRKISKKEKEKRKLIAFRVMIALLCIAAVSYTHLDVYKRQRSG